MVGVHDVPTGICGISGVVLYTVVEEPVPPLLPNGLIRSLQGALLHGKPGDGDIFESRAFRKEHARGDRADEPLSDQRV